MSRSRMVLSATLLIVAGLLAAALPVAAADQQVVQGRDIAGHGTLLVASSNGMTVYTFTKDVANSGQSNCTGGCLTKWPALTIAAGSTPSGGNGVDASKLGTLVRSDDGQTQVTYAGKPLYFFEGDSKPGDTNGIYPNWEAVTLQSVQGVSASGSASATAPATSTAGTASPAGDSIPWLLIALVVGVVLAGSAGALAYRRTTRD